MQFIIFKPKWNSQFTLSSSDDRRSSSNYFFEPMLLVFGIQVLIKCYKMLILMFSH